MTIEKIVEKALNTGSWTPDLESAMSTAWHKASYLSADGYLAIRRLGRAMKSGQVSFPRQFSTDQ